MCELTTALMAIAAGTQVASGSLSAYSSYTEGAAQKKYYDSLADRSIEEGKAAQETAQRQSEAVQDTAKSQGLSLKEQQAQFNASNRAAFAAQGITGVTAEEIVSSNLTKQRMDELVLRRNADMKSWELLAKGKYDDWALRTQANEYRYAGKSAKRAGKLEATGTLLSTASKAAQSFANF